MYKASQTLSPQQISKTATQILNPNEIVFNRGQ